MMIDVRVKLRCRYMRDVLMSVQGLGEWEKFFFSLSNEHHITYFKYENLLRIGYELLNIRTNIKAATKRVCDIFN